MNVTCVIKTNASHSNFVKKIATKMVDFDLMLVYLELLKELIGNPHLISLHDL